MSERARLHSWGYMLEATVAASEGPDLSNERIGLLVEGTVLSAGYAPRGLRDRALRRAPLLPGYADAARSVSACWM
jgi:hypothetical protein